MLERHRRLIYGAALTVLIVIPAAGAWRSLTYPRTVRQQWESMTQVQQEQYMRQVVTDMASHLPAAQQSLVIQRGLESIEHTLGMRNYIDEPPTVRSACEMAVAFDIGFLTGEQRKLEDGI